MNTVTRMRTGEARTAGGIRGVSGQKRAKAGKRSALTGDLSTLHVTVGKRQEEAAILMQENGGELTSTQPCEPRHQGGDRRNAILFRHEKSIHNCGDN